MIVTLHLIRLCDQQERRCAQLHKQERKPRKSPEIGAPSGQGLVQYFLILFPLVTGKTAPAWQACRPGRRRFLVEKGAQGTWGGWGQGARVTAGGHWRPGGPSAGMGRGRETIGCCGRRLWASGLSSRRDPPSCSLRCLLAVREAGRSAAPGPVAPPLLRGGRD